MQVDITVEHTYHLFSGLTPQRMCLGSARPSLLSSEASRAGLWTSTLSCPATLMTSSPRRSPSTSWSGVHMDHVIPDQSQLTLHDLLYSFLAEQIKDLSIVQCRKICCNQKRLKPLLRCCASDGSSIMSVNVICTQPVCLLYNCIRLSIRSCYSLQINRSLSCLGAV